MMTMMMMICLISGGMKPANFKESETTVIIVEKIGKPPFRLKFVDS